MNIESKIEATLLEFSQRIATIVNDEFQTLSLQQTTALTSCKTPSSIIEQHMKFNDIITSYHAYLNKEYTFTINSTTPSTHTSTPLIVEDKKKKKKTPTPTLSPIKEEEQSLSPQNTDNKIKSNAALEFRTSLRKCWNEYGYKMYKYLIQYTDEDSKTGSMIKEMLRYPKEISISKLIRSLFKNADDLRLVNDVLIKIHDLYEQDDLDGIKKFLHKDWKDITMDELEHLLCEPMPNLDSPKK